MRKKGRKLPQFVADFVENGFDLLLVLLVLNQLVHLGNGILAKKTIGLVADTLARQKQEISFKLNFYFVTFLWKNAL
jgi:hypothetical protein